MDNNFLFLCVLQVTLANESMVLYMWEGKVLMDSIVLCVCSGNVLNGYFFSFFFLAENRLGAERVNIQKH